MKDNEQFRASVYARAERKKEQLAARRQKLRNASLSAAMVLLAAALAVPAIRNTRTGDAELTAPDTRQQVLHIPNRAAPVYVLLMSTGSGDTQAVVLENKDQQKEFVSKYKAAMNLGEDDSLPMPAADTDRAIYSAEELTAYLTELLEAAGPTVLLDYDEAFFLDNNLYAMPMDLTPQQGGTPREDTIIPGATIPDAQTAEAETMAGETTGPAASLPENELLQGADVKVLLLVPVNKG